MTWPIPEKLNGFITDMIPGKRVYHYIPTKVYFNTQLPDIFNGMKLFLLQFSIIHNGIGTFGAKTAAKTI